MASSTRACAINKCEISSCAICHCCQKDLCLDHLKDHKDQLNSKLIPLANQINTLTDNLEHFTPTSLPSFEKLEQWRVAAHETVDRFCEHMRNELAKQKNKPLQELRTARESLDQLIRRQGATVENINLLTNAIRSIEQEINGLKDIEINLRPLIIDVNSIFLSNFSIRLDQSVSATNKNQNPAQENNSFQIFVQLLNGKHILVTVKPSDTIMDVKRQIHAKEGFSTEGLRLFYVGKQLIDNYTIATYGIQRQSTINLLFCPIRLKNDESQS